MSSEDTKDKSVDIWKSKIKQYSNNESPVLPGGDNYSWNAVSKAVNKGIEHEGSEFDFIGKNLENGKFAGENLEGANFSVANLSGVDFSNANLKGVDFSGANLTDANLEGADLSGAVLSGSVLLRTNFTGAKMRGVRFTDADLEDAILLGIDIDDIALEELQSLIEYLAKYYPHKLNLTKMNLTLLDLTKIDLTRVSLRGVDFTGCDFTGVNIMELDLSECIITPEQIAQALGRVPGKEELARILAPKKKNLGKKQALDLSKIFLDDGREFGVLDLINAGEISVSTLLKVGKKVFRHAEKPPVKDEDALKNIKTEHELEVKNHNHELRKTIEAFKEKKREEFAEKKKELQNEGRQNEPQPQQEQEEIQQEKPTREMIMALREQNRGRD